MSKGFLILCKACGGGWVMVDVASEDTPEALILFPQLLCLNCGAKEDMRSNMTRTATNLVAHA